MDNEEEIDCDKTFDCKSQFEKVSIRQLSWNNTQDSNFLKVYNFRKVGKLT